MASALNAPGGTSTCAVMMTGLLPPARVVVDLAAPQVVRDRGAGVVDLEPFAELVADAGGVVHHLGDDDLTRDRRHDRRRRRCRRCRRRRRCRPFRRCQPLPPLPPLPPAARRPPLPPVPPSRRCRHGHPCRRRRRRCHRRPCRRRCRLCRRRRSRRGRLSRRPPVPAAARPRRRPCRRCRRPCHRRRCRRSRCPRRRRSPPVAAVAAASRRCRRLLPPAAAVTAVARRDVGADAPGWRTRARPNSPRTRSAGRRLETERTGHRILSDGARHVVGGRTQIFRTAST